MPVINRASINATMIVFTMKELWRDTKGLIHTMITFYYNFMSIESTVVIQQEDEGL